jgi:DNA mismatch endonuclease (patch repair protein)
MMAEPTSGKARGQPQGYPARMTLQGKSWASSDRTRNVMRGNRSRDTRPELAVRSAVHRLGLRFRVSVSPLKDVRRSADLVFVSARVAVFVDGCFWHGCPDHYVPSRSNREYWADKISRNRARDSDTDRRLQEAGWLPIRVWAHEDPAGVAPMIADAVRERTKKRQLHPHQQERCLQSHSGEVSASALVATPRP